MMTFKEYYLGENNETIPEWLYQLVCDVYKKEGEISRDAQNYILTMAYKENIELDVDTLVDIILAAKENKDCKPPRVVFPIG